MEVDYNLKKLDNFSSSSWVFLEKLLNTDLKFVFHWRNQLAFFLLVPHEIFIVKEMILC